MTHNRLTTAADIEAVLTCPSLRILDFSHNKLEDPKVVDVSCGFFTLNKQRLGSTVREAASSAHFLYLRFLKRCPICVS